jgi:site-specific recombinase XerD
VGSLYHQNLKPGKPSAIFWIKYYVNGRAIRESTRTTDREEAKRILKAREGAAATGQPILPRLDRIRYEEVAEDLRTYYKTTGRRNLREVDGRLGPLKAHFTGIGIAQISPTATAEYVARRQAAGLSNATINRELAILARALRLAYENGKLLRMPVIRKLKEAAPRSGFFEREQYEAVRRRLRPDLRVVVTIAYTYGWRVRSEVLRLERRHLDLKSGTLRLDPGMTKNEEGRVIYLTPELVRLLIEQLERIRTIERKTGRIIPCLFPYFGGRQRLGQRRRDFRRAWAKACEKAGCPGMLRHDFRRTAVRNMVNAGVSERVAMTVTGHKTRSVFDRYHIVSPADLQEVARRLTDVQAPQGLGTSDHLS